MAAPKVIYLDYNATTPVDRRVAEAIAKAAAGDDPSSPEFSSPFANPSSLHAYAKAPKELLAKARGHVAALLGCGGDDESASQVLFESGGTESINHVLKGVVMHAWKERKDKGTLESHGRPHVVTTAIEHVAVLDTCKFLSDYGFCDVTKVSVNAEGVVAAKDVAAAVIPGRTVIVSVMLANNETGAVQPVKAIVEAVRAVDASVLIHTDASQCLGKLPFDVKDLGVDFLTVAGHKLYAPKGVGFTYVRKEVNSRLPVFVHGAGQENGRRAGTENLLLIAGLGKACELCLSPSGSGLDIAQVEHSMALRDRLAANLMRLWAERVAPALPSEAEEPFASRSPVVHGPLSKVVSTGAVGVAADIDNITSLPNTLSIAFPGAFAAKMVALLADSVAVSAGAACHSHAPGDPKQASVSHVLAAMGVAKTTALCTLRLSVGRWSTEEEVGRAAELIIAAVLEARKHRSHAGLVEMAKEERSAAPTPAAAVATSAGTAAAGPPTLVATTPLYLQDTYRFHCDDALVVAALPVQATAAKAGSTSGAKEDVSPVSAVYRIGSTEVTLSGPAVPKPNCGAADKVAVLALDRTVAHPQGGGQPSDRGIITFDGDATCMFVFHAVRKAGLSPVVAAGANPAAVGAKSPYLGEVVLHYGYFTSSAASAAASAQEVADSVQDDGSLGTSATASSSIAMVESSSYQGRKCQVFVNASHRRVSARLHSAGHLLDLAVRRVIDRLIAASPAAAASAASAPASDAAPVAAATPSSGKGAGKGKGSSASAGGDDNLPLQQLVPGKGYHFKDGPYVEYDGSIPSRYLADFPRLVEEACQQLLQADAGTAVKTVTVGAGAPDESGAALASVGLKAEDVSHLPAGSPVRIVAIGGETNTCPCGGTHVKRASEIGSRIVVTKVASKKGKTKVNYELA